MKMTFQELVDRARATRRRLLEHGIPDMTVQVIDRHDANGNSGTLTVELGALMNTLLAELVADKLDAEKRELAAAADQVRALTTQVKEA